MVVAHRVVGTVTNQVSVFIAFIDSAANAIGQIGRCARHAAVRWITHFGAIAELTVGASGESRSMKDHREFITADIDGAGDFIINLRSNSRYTHGSVDIAGFCTIAV